MATSSEEFVRNFLCAGIWFSWINSAPPAPNNDDIIRVDPENGSGDFGGAHHGRRIRGNCQDNPHSIRFQRDDPDGTHFYWGNILQVGSGLRARGHHRFVPTVARVGTFVDDEWLAEKGTTFALANTKEEERSKTQGGQSETQEEEQSEKG